MLGRKVGQVAKRGKVKGFSRASARRMRQFVFRLDYSDAVAVTLTHPVVMDGMRGPEAAFDAMRKVSKRFPWLRALLWRKEVQRNGNAHYHTVLWPSVGVDCRFAAEEFLNAWIDTCLAGWDVPSCFVDSVRQSMERAHHDKKSPAVRVMPGSCYVRYILDHSSKHKREQAQTTGRAWGVWNRANLKFVIPKEYDLTEHQFYVTNRILRKVCRYALKAPCSFGWKHSRGRRSNGWGTTVYFGRTNDGGLADKIIPFVLSDAFEPFALDVYAQGRFFRLQHCSDEEFGPLD